MGGMDVAGRGLDLDPIAAIRPMSDSESGSHGRAGRLVAASPFLPGQGSCLPRGRQWTDYLSGFEVPLPFSTIGKAQVSL
jgi:hypothetical protein